MNWKNQCVPWKISATTYLYLIFVHSAAYIIPPSGKRMFPKIEDNKDGSVTLKYQPKETGLHALHVCYNNQEITGKYWKK